MQRSHCPEHGGRCPDGSAEQHRFSVLESCRRLGLLVREKSETSSRLDNLRRLLPYRDTATTRRECRTEQSDLSPEGRTPRRQRLSDNTAWRAVRWTRRPAG